MQNTLTLAIIGHLVGDYLIQNDWMALNKKKQSINCIVHVTLWTLSVCFFTGWWTLPVIAILWVTHYAQDSTNIISRYMTAIGQRQFANGPCAPWSIIVVDNVWHILALWVVWRFMV